MTVRYAITHLTEYEYAAPVAVSHNEARLRPRSLPHQTVLESDVSLEPEANRHARFVDYFGNEVDYVEFREPVSLMRVRSAATVDRSAPPPLEERDPLPWHRLLGVADVEISEFRLDSPLVHRSEPFRAYAAPSFRRGRSVVDAVSDLVRRIHDEFRFDATATEVHTAVEDVLEARAGVCQDFAHVAIACLRSMGLAARYTSGYLRTTPPPGQPRLLGADASHAWVAVHHGDGWIDFDPTNDVIPGEGHVTLAWGRDYGDVPPVRGVLIGGGSTVLRVSVDVVAVEG